MAFKIYIFLWLWEFINNLNWEQWSCHTEDRILLKTGEIIGALNKNDAFVSIGKTKNKLICSNMFIEAQFGPLYGAGHQS